MTNYAVTIIKNLTMNTLKSLIVALIIGIIAPTQAQTADEIIDTYLENTGGKENWKKLTGTKMVAQVNQGGMVIPVTIYSGNKGEQAVVIELQGKTITQFAFDGETMWSTNFMTMKAEKSDKETTDNMKLSTNDFPNPFIDYKEKGYTVEYLGKETKEGTETFKVQLTTEPVSLNGVESPSISYYYFETENYVPIMVETTQGANKTTVTMSDYQEVDGLYFPFSMSQGPQPIEIKEIVLNPEIEATLFAFPAEK